MYLDTSKFGKITKENYEKDLEIIQKEARSLPQFYRNKVEYILYSGYANLATVDISTSITKAINELRNRQGVDEDNLGKCTTILNDVIKRYNSRTR